MLFSIPAILPTSVFIPVSTTIPFPLPYVIKLDEKCTDPVKVYVENQEYYYGKPGTIGKNMGVTILDIIDKDVKEYE